MQCLFGLKGTVPECVRVQGIFPNDPCRSTIAALLRCGSNFFRLYLLPKTQLFCALIRFEKTTGETDLCLAYQTCVRLVQPDTGKALALCFGESLQDPIGIILMHKFNSSERNNSWLIAVENIAFRPVCLLRDIGNALIRSGEM